MKQPQRQRAIAGEKIVEIQPHPRQINGDDLLVAGQAVEAEWLEIAAQDQQGLAQGRAGVMLGTVFPEKVGRGLSRQTPIGRQTQTRQKAFRLARTKLNRHSGNSKRGRSQDRDVERRSMRQTILADRPASRPRPRRVLQARSPVRIAFTAPPPAGNREHKRPRSAPKPVRVLRPRLLPASHAAKSRRDNAKWCCIAFTSGSCGGQQDYSSRKVRSHLAWR